jgi:hypothetical protein
MVESFERPQAAPAATGFAADTAASTAVQLMHRKRLMIDKRASVQETVQS